MVDFSGGGGFGGHASAGHAFGGMHSGSGFATHSFFARIIFPRAPRLTGIQLARPESLAQL